jgi:hypothetical protein
MDARGLLGLDLTAADNTSAGHEPRRFADALNTRSLEYFDTQEGLNYLAERDGRLFITTRTTSAALCAKCSTTRRAIYLIGFRPDESVFAPVKGRRASTTSR